VLFHNDNKTRLNPNFGHQQQGLKGTHIPWQNEIHPEENCAVWNNCTVECTSV